MGHYPAECDCALSSDGVALLANKWKPSADDVDACRGQQYQGYRAIGCVSRNECLFPQCVAGSMDQCRDYVDLRRILPRSNAGGETAGRLVRGE